MAKEKYPLHQLMAIKKNRYDQAIIELEKRKQELQKEEEKLQPLEKARDEVLHHKQEKLAQMRQTLDGGTTADKIQQMKEYLSLVDEQLAEKEQKVASQKKVVSQKQEEVEKATELVFMREKDVEKLLEHQKDWSEEARYMEKKAEEKEQDELGSAAHILKNIEKRKKSS